MQHAGPFPFGGSVRDVTIFLQRKHCYWRSTGPFEIHWQGDRSLITGVVHGDGSAYEAQDSQLCVFG